MPWPCFLPLWQKGLKKTLFNTPQYLFEEEKVLSWRYGPIGSVVNNNLPTLLPPNPTLMQKRNPPSLLNCTLVKELIRRQFQYITSPLCEGIQIQPENGNILELVSAALCEQRNQICFSCANWVPHFYCQLKTIHPCPQQDQGDLC